MTRRSTALPVRPDQENTCTTSPCSPGVLAGIFASVMSVSGSPETYASRCTESSATPPLAPGILIVWRTRPFLSDTIRTSFWRYPAETVQ